MAPRASFPLPTAAPTPPPNSVIRFRLSDIDVVQSTERSPYDLRASPFLPKDERLAQVPVVRVFGATDQGQRVVAHIHGAFPYLYVEYKGDINPEAVNSYIYRLGRSLNIAMELTQKKPQYGNQQKKTPQTIAYIVLCKATPFYGFHVGYRPYLKIYIAQPKSKVRVAEVLRSGAVMKTKFEVFEAHIPFKLQFLLDANLYGCGWVETSECLFRGPLPAAEDVPYTPPFSDSPLTPSAHGHYAARIYSSQTVERQHLYPDNVHAPAKISYCPLEIDLPVWAIMNRHDLVPRDLHHEFVERLHPSQVDGGVRYVHSIDELWVDERRRRRAQGRDGPHEVKDSTQREWDDREEGAPQWKTEPEHRARLEKLAEADLRNYRSQAGFAKRTPAFETFAEEAARHNKRWNELMLVKTAFEQVEALFPDRMAEDERNEAPYGAWAVKGIGISFLKDQTARPFDAQQARRSESVIPEVDQGILRATQGQFDKLPDDDDDGEGYDSDERQGSRPPSPVKGGRRPRYGSVAAQGRRREGSARASVMPGDEDDDDGGYGTDFDEPDAEEAIAGLDAVREEPAGPSRDGSPMKRTPSPQKERSPTGDLATVAEERVSEPPQKRVKRSVSKEVGAVDEFAQASAMASKFGRSPASSYSRPNNRLRTSPLKAGAVRRAAEGAQPVPHQQVDDSDEDMPLLSARDNEQDPRTSQSTVDSDIDLPPPQQRVVDDLLHGLNEDDLSDYYPTPTERIPTQPSQIPSHQRPTPDIESDVKPPTQPDPTPSLTSSSTSSSLEPDAAMEVVYESSAEIPATVAPTKKQVAFGGATFAVASSQSTVSAASPEPSATQMASLGPFVESDPSNEEMMLPSNTLLVSQHIRPSQLPVSRNSYIWAFEPPTAQQLAVTLEPQRPRVLYRDPFYSIATDRSSHRKEYAGRQFDVKAETMKHMVKFEHWNKVESMAGVVQSQSPRRALRCKAWEYAPLPPSSRDMKAWLALERNVEGLTIEEDRARAARSAPHIENPTQKNPGVKIGSSQAPATMREKQHMAVLAVELHINTRGKLLPDPKEDPIMALFYCLKSENEEVTMNGRAGDTHIGVIAVGSSDLRARLGKTDYILDIVEDEQALFNMVIDKVRQEWDPEALAGFEVHHASWGYLLERAHKSHDWELVRDLGRIADSGRLGTAQTDRWGFNQHTYLNVSGRHILPIWRILKADTKLQHNNFEHVAFQVLHKRTPHFSFETLTTWYSSGDPNKLARVFDYYRNRVEMDIEMIVAAEVIEQNCEAARVYGVDFKSVRTRGSQFKVESVMFKISKPESFMLLSPSRTDVGRQNAAECQPLIMEPPSGFYKSPVVVLDFQSLYPSVMIGFNYCYSTCLGRIGMFKGEHKFGTTNLELEPGLLWLLKDHVNISPNGFLFLKPYVRKSLLSKMLSDLLDTRVMIKSSMKGVEDPTLTRLLNARQLALKLLANVTYGYTSATFSGRMPCVEVADAIVQTGRESLEKALELINSTKEWGAKVLYGDTDSLFIFLPGKSKSDAFRIGNEMADTVTSLSPRPMKLKFEKVYLPCVLLAKKRYVGFKFEHLSDEKPEFDAKGIETVRRDGIPALQKMQETCLKILFRTADLSLVKAYCQRQWKKMLAGEVSAQDFIIAKAVKLGSYAVGRAPPPGAVVAQRAMNKDPRAEPEYGERVPYLLLQAEGKTLQIDRALSPAAFLADSRHRLDVHHYIERAMIKPLERIFFLVGADPTDWFREMPKVQRILRSSAQPGTAKVMLDEHFVSDRCAVCGGSEGNGGVCASCQTNPGEVAYSIMTRVRSVQTRERALHQICSSCSSTRDGDGIACDSIDCSLMWERAGVAKERLEVLKLQSLL